MECLITFIKDWGGLILSSFGIIGGIWAYFKHDKKLKRQESKLNEMLIRQYEKEEAKDKMAEMKANIISNYKGTAKIRFVNAGKADACNVRIELLTSDADQTGIIHKGNFGPYEVINPQSYREEKLWLSEGHSDTFDIKIIWNDEYKKDRNISLSVPF